MIDLRFDWEWDDPRAARGPELAATWARLGIWCGKRPVTEVLDYRTRGVREAIYGPLYPLAEWIAFNWWPLLFESDRLSAERFDSRHNLQHVDSGYAFPSLTLQFVGESCELHWAERDLKTRGVRFISSGTAIASRTQVISELRRLATAVVDRLNECNVSDTPLQREWSEIERKIDSDELEYCVAAGMLGLDPYSIDENSSGNILKAAELVPGPIHGEFFSSCQVSTIISDAHWIDRQIHGNIPAKPVDASLKRLKDDLRGSLNANETPWDQGYRLARTARQHLRLEDGAVSFEDLAGGSVTKLVVESDDAPRTIDGLVCGQDNAAVFFLKRRTHKQPLRFLEGRALCEYLIESPWPSLLSEAETATQKRNRAFAAEFLAPSHYLRERLHQDGDRLEVREDLADELMVSTWVISYQINNHGIAQSL